MQNEYKLEKAEWNEKDFDVMGWHDAKMHSFAFDPDKFELIFDLDYIFEWIKGEDQFYSFWVSPVTMVFENAFDVKVELEIGSIYELEIADIKQVPLGKTPNEEHDQFRYEIECQNGSISLTATGFKMYVRKHPLYTASQSLSLQERGGLSFGRELLRI
jgi:hypothetical protein